MTATTSTATGVERFVGYRFPGGSYTIAPDKHALFLQAVDGIPSVHGNAHPVMHFIATHAGKGMAFDALVALLDLPLDGGALFGQEDLQIFRPVRIGETVTVRGGIVEARAKTGSKTGPFVVLTTEIELVDAAGEVVCRSLETYILPSGKGA